MKKEGMMMAKEVTIDMLERARGECKVPKLDEISNYNKCLVDSINAQLQEPDDPYYWVDWERVEPGTPILKKSAGALGALISENGIVKRVLIDAKTASDDPDYEPELIIETEDGEENLIAFSGLHESIKPDFSRRGYWPVKEPLKGRPKGLRGDALLTVYTKNTRTTHVHADFIELETWRNAIAIHIKEP